MKKVFISQPMAGRTEKEIMGERLDVMDKLAKAYPGARFKITESYFGDFAANAERTDAGNVPLKYLSRALWMLADCDIAYFCDGWENARGCRIEHEAALAYSVPIFQK